MLVTPLGATCVKRKITMRKLLLSVASSMVLVATAHAQTLKTPDHVGAFDFAWYTSGTVELGKCYLSSSTEYQPLKHPSTADGRWSIVEIVRNEDNGDLLGFRNGPNGTTVEIRYQACAAGSNVVMPAYEVEQDRTGTSGKFPATERGEAPPMAVMAERPQ